MADDEKCNMIKGFSMSFGSDGIWLNSPLLNGKYHSVNLKAELIGPRSILGPMAQDFIKEINKKED